MNPTNPTTARPTASRQRLAAIACAGAVALLSGCETIRGWFGGGDDQKSQSAPVVQPDANAEARYQPFPPTTQPAPSSSRTSNNPLPQTLQPTNRPVNQGPVPDRLPVVYIVEADGPIRVANVDSGEEIATFNAKAGQIVSVTLRGVMLGGRAVTGGATLAPGTYGIYVLPPDAAPGGFVRTTEGRTVTPPPAPPASRPVNLDEPPAPPGFQRLPPHEPPTSGPATTTPPPPTQ